MNCSPLSVEQGNSFLYLLNLRKFYTNTSDTRESHIRRIFCLCTLE